MGIKEGMMEMYMDLFDWSRKFVYKFDFHKDFNTLEKLDFAIHGLIMEEVGEMLKAHEEKDAEELIDALGDIAWLCVKLMYQLDVDPYKVFQEIGKANLSKERGIKPGREQSGGFDVIKPKGWKGPDHSKNHGRLDGIYKA